jgi:hypothetical protein
MEALRHTKTCAKSELRLRCTLSGMDTLTETASVTTFHPKSVEFLYRSAFGLLDVLKSLPELKNGSWQKF